MERTQKVNLLLQLVPDHRQILRQLPLGAAAPSGLAFSPSAFAPLLGTGAVLLLVLVVVQVRRRGSRLQRAEELRRSEQLVAHVVRFGERIDDLARERGVSASTRSDSSW